MAEMRIYYCNKYCYTINDSLKKRYNNALLTYILYEPKYQPLFPLHMPTPYQQQKLKYFHISFLRKLFKIEFHIIRYLNAGINRLKNNATHPHSRRPTELHENFTHHSCN
jgi:hypothetical protein